MSLFNNNVLTALQTYLDMYNEGLCTMTELVVAADAMDVAVQQVTALQPHTNIIYVMEHPTMVNDMGWPKLEEHTLSAALAE